MPRSSSAPVLVAAATVAASMAAATAATVQQTQPHLVFLMADQLRWNTNGYRGGELNLTVNLDRIAAEGLEMKYSFASTPTCTPARASLLTGQSPGTHGMLGCVGVRVQEAAARCCVRGHGSQNRTNCEPACACSS